MKVFEKWWQKTGVNQRTLRFKNGLVLDKAYRSGIKDGWRASLEWFYDNLGYCEEHEILKDLIEKELDGRDVGR